MQGEIGACVLDFSTRLRGSLPRAASLHGYRPLSTGAELGNTDNDNELGPV